MSVSLKVNFDYCKNFVSEYELEYLKDFAELSQKKLISGQGQGGEFTGWISLPKDYDKDEFDRIKTAAEKIRKNSDILVVIGIGGSYLGARAVIEALTSNFKNDLSTEKRAAPKILFAGNNLSAAYLSDLIEVLEEKDFSINVISKSGTTTEPAIAFRILKKLLEERYGKSEAKERIFVTTDRQKGALKTMADNEGYETFVVPDNIGGRYTVLTAVGLVPIAAAGIDIDALIKGAYDAASDYKVKPFHENSALKYAAYRNIFLRKGKLIEVLASYEPNLAYFGEWYKQLFAESEGKDGKGMFTVSMNLTTDLHSLGQFIQEGRRIFFETIIDVKNTKKDIMIESESSNNDGLNYLAGKKISEVNKTALKGVVMAHVDGGVPNIIIELEKLDAYNIGQLIYFFEFSCGESGYINGINPFDQPGVEYYKKNMFALLGKVGYEEQRKKLEQRLGQKH